MSLVTKVGRAVRPYFVSVLKVSWTTCEPEFDICDSPDNYTIECPETPIYTCIYVSIYMVCIYASIAIRTHIYTYMCIYIYVYTSIYMYIHMYVHNIYTYVDIDLTI